MPELKLAPMERKFADLVWKSEPITTRELIKLCEKELMWKRTTTYTVLKKLCDRGIFKTEEGIVSAVYKRDDFYAEQGKEIVDKAFGGSLPAFIAAFTKRKALSKKEIDEIKEMIEHTGEE